MADMTLTKEDEISIRSILLAERARGIANPLLPADVDIDGDGIVDSFGLDAFGNVVVVPGVKLKNTVFRSDGEDVMEGG